MEYMCNMGLLSRAHLLFLSPIYAKTAYKVGGLVAPVSEQIHQLDGNFEKSRAESDRQIMLMMSRMQGSKTQQKYVCKSPTPCSAGIIKSRTRNKTLT